MKVFIMFILGKLMNAGFEHAHTDNARPASRRRVLMKTPMVLVPALRDALAFIHWTYDIILRIQYHEDTDMRNMTRVRENVSQTGVNNSALSI